MKMASPSPTPLPPGERKKRKEEPFSPRDEWKKASYLKKREEK